MELMQSESVVGIVIAVITICYGVPGQMVNASDLKCGIYIGILPH